MTVFLKRYNERQLPFPPASTTPCGASDVEKLIKAVNSNMDPESTYFTSIGDLLQDIIESLEKCKSQVNMHDSHLKENNIMFTYVYHSGRHRSEKFYSHLKKLSKCVRRWEEVELGNHIDRLLVVLKDTENNSMSTSYLPNVLLVDYTLSQLKATFELHLKLASYAFETAVLLRSKIAIGHFSTTALVFFASVSRIRLISVSMAKVLAHCFDKIRLIYIGMQKAIGDKSVNVAILSPDLQRENRNFCWCKGNTQDPPNKPKTIAKRSHKMEVVETEGTELSDNPIAHISYEHHEVAVNDQYLMIEDYHPPTAVTGEYIGEAVERTESSRTHHQSSTKKLKRKPRKHKNNKDHLHQIKNIASSKKRKRRRKGKA